MDIVLNDRENNRVCMSRLMRWIEWRHWDIVGHRDSFLYFCGSILAIANPADHDIVARQVRILNRRLKPRLSRKDVNRVARCCGTTAQKWSNDTIVMLLGMTKEEAKAFSAPIEENEGKGVTICDVFQIPIHR